MVHVMNIGRSTVGINKAGDANTGARQIMSTDALRWVSLMTLAKRSNFMAVSTRRPCATGVHNIWFEAMLIILALKPQDDAVSRQKGQQVVRAPPGHL